jgi:hypothetical protein
MWAFGYMKGWKSNENVEFNFHDAHDLNVLTALASEQSVKRKLRERFASSKQVIVLIGESTRHLYRFVRWEIDIALDLNLPIIAVNLGGKRTMDDNLCPPILKGQYVVHVPFKAKTIQYALDTFPSEHARRGSADPGDRVYGSKVYRELGL